MGPRSIYEHCVLYIDVMDSASLLRAKELLQRQVVEHKHDIEIVEEPYRKQRGCFHCGGKHEPPIDPIIEEYLEASRADIEKKEAMIARIDKRMEEST